MLKVFLREGDIVSVDLVVYKNGFNGDCARTYIVGNASEEAKKLVDITRKAFFEGIKYAKKGNRVGDISHAIGEFVTKNGYSVVKEFQGHGIGRNMHEDPFVFNYRTGNRTLLKTGMTIAIEPMLNLGKDDVYVLDDDWTVVTADEKASAHFEHTVLVGEDGPEILTKLS